MKSFDSIVLGLGAMGTAACYQLANRGQRVLGIDQFQLTHDRGSSHGETRIIRKAYFENPGYVPLLLRAYELWKELEALSEQEILVQNGLVIFGRPATSQVYQGTLTSGKMYGIPVEELSFEEALRRFPLYRPPQDFSAVFEPSAGFLHAERAILAHAFQARRQGAVLLENETVQSYEVKQGIVTVRSDKDVYSARRLVIAGGGWSSRLLNDLGLPLTLRRMLLAWFRASQDHSLEQKTPCFIFDLDDDFYYGFPQLDGQTIKIAAHHGFETMENPGEKDAIAPSPRRIEALRTCIRACLPKVSSELVRAVHCIYTMTPDENFVVDLHPHHPEVVFAAGFSGHGFKFASVVGEILADLATSGRTRHPIDFLRADRFLELRP